MACSTMLLRCCDGYTDTRIHVNQVMRCDSSVDEYHRVIVGWSDFDSDVIVARR